MSTDNIIEYEIPEEIKSRIPDQFYYSMIKELVYIFGMSMLAKVEGSYYDLQSSIGGWVEAFKTTCKKLGMEWLLDYYETLDWYESDVFAGIIESYISDNFIGERI